MHPVYQFLRRELPADLGGGGGEGFGKDIGWNFFKVGKARSVPPQVSLSPLFLPLPHHSHSATYSCVPLALISLPPRLSSQFVVNTRGKPVKLLPQNFDRDAVEEAVLQLLEYKPRVTSGVDTERRLTEELGSEDAAVGEGEVQAPEVVSRQVPAGLFALVSVSLPLEAQGAVRSLLVSA